ncbi:hypothetical protein ACI1G1_000315 [Vibrio cholerae]|nr:hypothetical protein [Vibrio cholerae]
MEKENIDVDEAKINLDEVRNNLEAAIKQQREIGKKLQQELEAVTAIIEQGYKSSTHKDAEKLSLLKKELIQQKVIVSSAGGGIAAASLGAFVAGVAGVSAPITLLVLLAAGAASAIGVFAGVKAAKEEQNNV